MFELKKRDGLARIGVIETAHGRIETPTLLPVINPRKVVITPTEMASMGAEIIITNSYIIKRNEEMREIALSKGVHELVGFDGPIMTDSGTFQSHVYGKVKVEPQEIVEFQREIGSDIGTILDIFTEPDDPRDVVERAVDTTLARAREAAGIHGDMVLAGPVQGSIFPDIRTRCARSYSDIDCGIHPIGGIVPLMESYRYSDLARIVLASKKGLRPSRPVHLFGAGHPMMFPLAAYLGGDMLDSSSYIKYARGDRMMFPSGTSRLGELEHLPCSCPACSDTTAAELKGMDEDDRALVLAEHNLRVSFAEIRAVKQAINDGSLFEMMARRARCHPELLAALHVVLEGWEQLERYAPIGRKAFMQTGHESTYRPVVRRFLKRIAERYSPPPGPRVFVDEVVQGESEVLNRGLARASADIWVSSPFGPVPYLLSHIYPVGYALFHSGTPILEPGMGSGFSMKVDSRKDIKGVLEHNAISLNQPIDPAVARVRATADHQFGKGAGNVLLDGTVEVVRSRNTDRIRNIKVDGEHVATMRNDGFLSIRFPGGRRLAGGLDAPAMRIVVEPDSAEFNVKGKSVFSRFVVDMDDEIRPGDDVLVVTEEYELVAVGRALLTRDEAMDMEKGVAVKVREGADQASNVAE